jgi:hypothetical protein
VNNKDYIVEEWQVSKEGYNMRCRSCEDVKHLNDFKKGSVELRICSTCYINPINKAELNVNNQVDLGLDELIKLSPLSILS